MLLLVACSVVATKIAALELRVSTTCSSRNPQLKTYTNNFAYNSFTHSLLSYWQYGLCTKAHKTEL